VTVWTFHPPPGGVECRRRRGLAGTPVRCDAGYLGRVTDLRRFIDEAVKALGLVGVDPALALPIAQRLARQVEDEVFAVTAEDRVRFVRQRDEAREAAATLRERVGELEAMLPGAQ
jgi:hypothetical protein